MAENSARRGKGPLPTAPGKRRYNGDARAYAATMQALQRRLRSANAAEFVKTLPTAPVHVVIDTAVLRKIAARARKGAREASLSPEAQAYLNALEYWYLHA